MNEIYWQVAVLALLLVILIVLLGIALLLSGRPRVEPAERQEVAVAIMTLKREIVESEARLEKQLRDQSERIRTELPELVRLILASLHAIAAGEILLLTSVATVKLRIQFSRDSDAAEGSVWQHAELVRYVLEAGINDDLSGRNVVWSFRVNEANRGSLDLVIVAGGYLMVMGGTVGAALVAYKHAREGLAELLKDLGEHYRRYRRHLPSVFQSSELHVEELRILEDYEVEQQILANENRRGRPYQR